MKIIHMYDNAIWIMDVPARSDAAEDPGTRASHDARQAVGVHLACAGHDGLPLDTRHASLVSAAVLEIINYQGRVVVQGTNFNGTGHFKFALVNNDGSGSQQLAPDQRIGSVGYAMRADGVTPGAVTTEMLADDVVTSTKIADGSISNVDLAVDSVTPNNVVDGTIDLADLDTASVDARYVNKSGDSMSGILGMGGNSITNTGDILPGQDNTFDLGTDTLRWQTLFMASKIDFSSDLEFVGGGNTDVVITTSGIVGIGTATPSAKLDVQGNSTGEVEVEIVNLNPGSNADADLEFSTDGATFQMGIDSTFDIFRIVHGSGFPEGSSGSGSLVMDSDGDVGIGNLFPINQLHVFDTINGNGSFGANYVAQIENFSSGNSPDVLALTVNTNNPGTAANFVGFFDVNSLIRQIEGNGSGGVVYNTSGADYAKYLPRLNPEEEIEAGDMVGVFGGKVTKRTKGAHQVMVFSSAPAVLGNMPRGEDDALYEKVAFIGQAPVKVRGPVNAGDYIVPSGRGDGTGVALNEEALNPENAELVLGRAWEGSAAADITKVRVAVGLSQHASVHRIMAAVHQENRLLRAENEELNSRVGELEETMASALKEWQMVKRRSLEETVAMALLCQKVR